MERLTDKSWRNLDPWECCGQDNFCTRGCHDPSGCAGGCVVPKLYARLGEYEDAMPLERAQGLAQAEKDGRLVVLPCRVGGQVYQTDGIRVYESKIKAILFDTDNITFSKDAIGKTVFLTREEAEAALKKMEESHEQNKN